MSELCARCMNGLGTVLNASGTVVLTVKVCFVARINRFFDQLIQAAEEFNVDGFSQHCFDYDQVLHCDVLDCAGAIMGYIVLDYTAL